MECPTKLFYYGKDDEYANLSNEDEFLQALAEGGYQVGELAKLYYPDGHDIKEFGYEKPLKLTNELFKQENVIIYEAAVAFENFFCSFIWIEYKNFPVDNWFATRWGAYQS